VADDDPIEPPTNVVLSQEIEPTTLQAGFDRYRSLSDPNLTIFVAKDVVPPFRFKSGGWELLQSSIGRMRPSKARSTNSFPTQLSQMPIRKYKRFGERTTGVDYVGLRLNSQQAVAS
jgi:hypothetical protein